MTADCHITNTGGTLVFQPLSWEERQRSRPAIRSVPRAATQHLDPDTHLVEVKTIDFTARLTDSEKTTLMAIFYANAQVTLQLYNDKQAGTWTYTGWLQKPQMNYEYKVENGANIRWWRCSLEVLVDTTVGPTSSGVEQIVDGSFELNVPVLTEMLTNGNFETGDNTGWSFSGFSISTDGPYSGTYCVKNTISPCSITQILAIPIVETDITNSIIHIKEHKYSGNQFHHFVTTVTYDDLTTAITKDVYVADFYPIYQSFDYLDGHTKQNKLVISIKFFAETVNSGSSNIWLDDISMIGWSGGTNAWKDGYNGNPVWGSTDQAHTGVRSLFLYSNYVIQKTPISVTQASIGSFGFWFIAPVTNTDTSYIIYFTDSTDSGVIAIPAGDYFSWTYFDILSQVPSGKSVAYIGFYGDSVNPTYVDDVSLITNSQSGLSDTIGVLLGAGALDATGIYLGFVTDFERVHEGNVQISNWLNQAPTAQINYAFFNNKLVRLTYTFKASDEDKYYIDLLLLTHSLVSLDDNTNNIDNTDNIWIEEISSRYTSDNWDRPWIVSISLLTEVITEHYIPPPPVPTEMVVNGGFEDSLDFHGWSVSGAGITVATDRYYTGVKSAKWGAYVVGQYIEQTFVSPIEVDSIQSAGLYWIKTSGGLGLVEFNVTIYYTDASTTIFNFSSLTDPMFWQRIDLSSLDSGKFIDKIRIESVTINGYGWIDDVSIIALI